MLEQMVNRAAACANAAGCDRGFHIHCVGLGSIPDSEWFCEQCCIERQVLEAAARRVGRQRQRARDVASPQRRARQRQPQTQAQRRASGGRLGSGGSGSDSDVEI
eukprot:305114-Chlamydomonas_euryale.AAC.2